MRQERESLAAEESSLDSAMRAALQRFEGWCASAPSRPRSPPSRAAARAPSCARARSEGAGRAEEVAGGVKELVKALSAKVEADGGNTGGWPEDDHSLFLRAMSKFKRRAGDGLMAELEQLLPHRMHEDLVAHVNWFQQFEHTQLEKRHLLEQWRTARAAARARSASQVQVLDVRAEQPPPKSRRQQQEAAEMRRLVSEWRESENQAMRAKEEELQHQRQEALEREALKRQQRQEQSRRDLEAFRARRQSEQMELQRLGERGASLSAEDRRLTQEDRSRIARRNSELAERRSSQVQARKAQQDRQAFAPPPRTSTAYAQVGSRLQSHTETYVDRARECRAEAAEAESSKYSVVPGSFAHQAVVRTVRACPGWRQGFGV